MSQQVSSRRCAFCGARGGLTREHAWPRWLRPLLDGAPDAPWVFEDNRGNKRAWSAPLASLTVRMVCRDCNGGWMNELETSVRPILSALIQGQPWVLTESDQRTLATWAAKTAMVCDLAGGLRAVSDEHRAWVRGHGEPPIGTVTLLARYSGGRFPISAGQRVRIADLLIGEREPQSVPVYVVSVSVGQVALQVFGHGVNRAVDMRPTSWKAGFARVIWPDPQPVNWPPRRGLDDAGLEQFFRSV